MTINSELDLTKTTAANLKTEITNKGQTVASTDTWKSLVAKIDAIDNSVGSNQVILNEVLDGSVQTITDGSLAYLRPHCFSNCTKLMNAEFKNITKICSFAFEACFSLHAVLLPGDKMVKLDNINAFRYTPIEKGIGGIYVKDSLLATYRADETWKDLYNQILPLSHYYSENCDIPIEYYSIQYVDSLPTSNAAKYCLYNTIADRPNISNVVKFKASKNSQCVEKVVIKKGTTWNVKIDNTSGWYDSSETSLTTNYTFDQDVTISISQVYPVLGTPMFSQSGTTNTVILSAKPTGTITEKDSIMKFVNATGSNDWANATHITLNKIDIGITNTSTSGWTNYQNAFDGNQNTYASCGTATDYLQVQYELPVYLRGFSANCNFASGVARACNISLSTYDTESEVLIANGTGGAETATYTTSATFDGTYARTLRFKLINSTAGTPPTTDYPTRVKELTLAVDPDSKTRISDLTDGHKMIHQGWENRTGTWSKLTETVDPIPTEVHELSHEYYYYNKQNYNVIGTPIINDDIVSNFATTSYITLPETFSPAGKTWEIVIDFTTGNSTSQQGIFGGVGSKDGCTCFYINSNNLVSYLSSNGSSWNIASAKTVMPVTVNTHYILKCKWTGSSYQYYQFINDEWQFIMEIASTAAIYDGLTQQVGTNRTTGYPFAGSINLNNFYILIDNVLWWKPVGKIYM